MAHTCMFLVSVPIIFFEQSVYSVSEEEGSVAVTVLSNGEHLTPVHFSIVSTNNSAKGETDMKCTKKCCYNCHDYLLS